TYRPMVKGIKAKIPEADIMNILYDRVDALFRRFVLEEFDPDKVKDEDLIVYVGIKSLITYAESRKIKNGRNITKVYIDENGEDIDDPIGPLDPRLVYKSKSQVPLALKMMKRGEEIPPNTRLEFLYLEHENKNAKVGEKAEDFTYYKENKDILLDVEGKRILKPDYLYYLENRLAKPVTELLKVKYPRPIVPYIDMKTKLLAFISNLSDLHRTRVSNMKEFNRPRPVKEKFTNLFIGWDALEKEGYKTPKCFNSKIQKRRESLFGRDNGELYYLSDDKEFEGISSPLFIIFNAKGTCDLDL